MWGSKLMSNYAAGAISRVRGFGVHAQAGGAQNVGAAALGVGNWMGRIFGGNPKSIGTLAGAVGGGMYGAVDRDTSVIGGALGGGLMGRGIGAAGRLAANRYGGAYMGSQMGLSGGGMRNNPISSVLGAIGSDIRRGTTLASNEGIGAWNALRGK